MRLIAALLLVAAAAAAGAPSAPSAPAAEVTLRAERFWSEACRCYKFRFAGAISSGAANEYVSVLQQKCGTSFSTSIAGTTTREGGFWEVESNGPVGGGTFRARWNNNLSDPVTHRAELLIRLTQLGGGQVRVEVDSFSSPLKLKGKFVELQRLSAGQWTRIRRARFSARRPGVYSATFTVKRRGLTLRAFVPAEAAAPCYAATASKTWTSGRAAGAESDRVMDRTQVCSVAIWGGIRQLGVGAAGLVPTEVVPRRGIGASSPWGGDAALAGASTESAWLNPNRCRPSTARVSFTSRGLRGGEIGDTRRSFECETPSRVLVRLRAAFAAPTPLAEDRTSGHRRLVANGEVTEAALAVRTLSGRPFAFASFSAAGRVSLFVARGCVADDS
jgi:hypothetical protein